MGHAHRGLEQQQALFGLLQIDTRSYWGLGLDLENLISSPVDDPVMVVLGKQSVVGELEPALALDTTVTFGVVALPSGENARNVAGEAEWAAFFGAEDPSRRPRL